MALKKYAAELGDDTSPKQQEELDLLSQYSCEGDAEALEKAKEKKLKEKQAKTLLKHILQVSFKLDDANEWLSNVLKHVECLSVKSSCMEKRSAMKTAANWDFVRMVPVEVDTYGKNLAVGNLKSFVIFRAQQIKNELDLGTSWKTYFKKLWYKILGKSFAWELACKEVTMAMACKMAFLKSDEGWGSNFDKNMSELLKQPW